MNSLSTPKHCRIKNDDNVTCGLGYYSFFEQMRRYRLGEIDPAPIPSSVVLVMQGTAVLLAIVALVTTLRAGNPEALPAAADLVSRQM